MLEPVMYLLMMAVVSPWDTRTMWTYWAKIGQRNLQRTGQLTTRSTWNQASIYRIAESIIFRKSCWNSQGIQGNKASQWMHPVIIIACSSTDHICKEKGQRPTTVCGLLRSQSSHGEQPISSPTDPRDAWQVAQRLDLHETGCSEWLSPHSNEGSR